MSLQYCIIRYSPEQLFAVVAAVDLYEDFVPWCQRSEIIRRNDDGSFDAELEIGFKFLVESYVSHVEMNKPKYIKVFFVLIHEIGPQNLLLEKPMNSSIFFFNVWILLLSERCETHLLMLYRH